MPPALGKGHIDAPTVILQIIILDRYLINLLAITFGARSTLQNLAADSFNG